VGLFVFSVIQFEGAHIGTFHPYRRSVLFIRSRLRLQLRFFLAHDHAAWQLEAALRWICSKVPGFENNVFAWMSDDCRKGWCPCVVDVNSTDHIVAVDSLRTVVCTCLAQSFWLWPLCFPDHN
jgi:hypothetical protein